MTAKELFRELQKFSQKDFCNAIAATNVQNARVEMDTERASAYVYTEFADGMYAEAKRKTSKGFAYKNSFAIWSGKDKQTLLFAMSYEKGKESKLSIKCYGMKSRRHELTANEYEGKGRIRVDSMAVDIVSKEQNVDMLSAKVNGMLSMVGEWLDKNLNPKLKKPVILRKVTHVLPDKERMDAVKNPAFNQGGRV